ncbi:MAG: DUF1015 domain-containing protein [Candidatus Methanoplasma sp.]|jgi:uncharacterized protein (DUF1015 family)|nr:DUF1015 domain-containing protein [Candidatus Methanoplasma sp.]
MVTFLPFPGYRPDLKTDERIEDRISPPYDVIGKEYLKILQDHKNNVTNLTLRPDVDRRYKGSRKELDRMISEGYLKQDSDSFYLYEQAFNDHGVMKTRVGLVGILKTESYEAGNVVPHEETFSKVKEDRLNLLRDMEAHLESIFGIFEGLSPELNKKLFSSARLIYRYMDSSGVDHRFHIIADQDIQKQITSELKGQKMLIADGHHRYETALNYSLENPGDEKKGYVLATLVAANDEGLVVWPTHRLVNSESISVEKAKNEISSALKTKKVSETEMESDLKNWMMGLMFRDGERFLAEYDKGDSELWKLDTYVVQELILKKIYGYDEGRSSVEYEAEFSNVKKMMADGRYDLAIVLNDPSLKTIWDLSMKGIRMPKKTTFFFPKIWSGFVFYKMS